jgi:general secretion pathway protein D
VAAQRGATFPISLALVVLLAVVASGDPAATARLIDVTVAAEPEAVTVHLEISSLPKYRARLLDSPPRLVLDLQETTYGWQATPLVVGTEPVKQIHGTQYRKSVTRVIVELTGRSEYAIHSDPTGLSIVMPRPAAGAITDRSLARSSTTPAAIVASSAQAVDVERRSVREAKPSQRPKAVKVDFKDVELPVFIRLVSDVTGKNFVFDERVTGKVTVITPKDVPVEELYQLLLEILQFKGYAAVPADDLIQIIPLSEARQNWTEVVSKGSGEGFVTRLIPLSYLNANEAIRILTPLVSRNGVVSADLQTNTIILTDAARNVERLASVLSGLDKEPPRGKAELHVYTLDNADAEEIAKSLTAVFSRQQPTQPVAPPGMRATLTGPVSVTADKTRNAVIVVAAPEDYAVMKDVIAKLDVKRRQEGKINVYPLEYAEAEDIAKTLTTLFARQPAQSTQPGQLPISVTLTGPVTVTADKARNSLVIVAAPEDYDALKQVIKQLDIRRRQVYVEAAIIEISDTKLRELGVEFKLGDTVPSSGSTTGFAGTSFGGIAAASQGPSGLAGLSGLAAGVVKGFITFNGVQFVNVLAFVRALQTEKGVNVLSTPHLLTTDNQKAEIVVGENVPFVSGQSQTSGGNVLTTVDRKDVGITLRLTPRVTEGNFVKLDIYQEISSLTQEVGFDPNKIGPVINKRYASTTVVAKDGETIAIGGLIKDNSTRLRSKVPLLGDIPILGWLFRYYNRQDEKTNLLIFITPTIVKDSTLGEITEKKRRELEKSREQMDGRDKNDGYR